MGRYVPPEHEGVISGNRLNKSHPLGQRARKPGCLVVRFEMPFPIWCAACPQPTIIGQGVRFNAEKKKTGSYYSTPIYSFTLKHAACGGTIVIQTDPKNTEYEIVSGARRRDLGAAQGDGSILTPREKEESRSTAISMLEKTISDRERLFDANLRIEELQDALGRHWDDPYEQNRRLRKAFRAGRHEREKNAAVAENLKERMSLGIELLPESEDDTRRAGLIDFGPQDDREDLKVLARPLFSAAAAKGKPEGKTNQKKRGMLKSEVALKKIEQQLVSEIVSNTRAARDPFLGFGSSPSSALGPKGLLPGLKKRKRAAEDEAAREASEPPLQKEGEQPKKEPPTKSVAGSTVAALVSYDSDSE